MIASISSNLGQTIGASKPSANTGHVAGLGMARTTCINKGAFMRATSPLLVTPVKGNLVAQNRSITAAAAAQAAGETKPVNPNEGTPEWTALVARAEFFFNDVQNEALAEQLRELKRYYEEQGRELDFFFVSEPAWLSRFPEANKVKRPCVALVSTDKTWMTFMKLRLDRVLKLDLGNMSIDEATKSTAPLPEFKPPEQWTAPYSPYAYGWWEVFMRK